MLRAMLTLGDEDGGESQTPAEGKASDGELHHGRDRSPWAKPPDTEPEPVPEAVDGVVSISIPEEILADPNPLWRCYVMGYFIGDAPHVGSIHATVNRILSSPKMGSKIDVQFLEKKIVLFRIENPQMRAHVIQRRYWHIADIPLVVNEWSPETALDPPDLSAMPMWVDLKGIPSLLFSHKALKCMSRAVGSFVKLHPSTEKCTRLDAARILVEVNLNKPPVEKISFLDKEGVKVLIDVHYPWLPPKCSDCNAWGHKGSNCISKAIQVLRKGKEIAAEVGNTEGVINGDGQVRYELNDTRNVVKDLLLELEALPSVVGSGVVGNETREAFVAGSSSNSKTQSHDWALVGGGSALSLLPIRERSAEGNGEHQEEGGVVISPSRFSISEIEEEEGEDNTADDDIEEGEVITETQETLVKKESAKSMRLRNGTSFKLSKQAAARPKDSKVPRTVSVETR
ncbi:hypothetical protein DY000_02020681 [Brassica cretica]|uniref:DUF4283 domain-containing protein n=1 Tax=Brassica cretica TaxID=69181 RepID=A0ABQ7EDA1_BRACR|nr:hypothetical protein DY000_02020681 [Brassica cretica]